MKKSKMSLLITAATVSLLSLAGCNEVTSKGNVFLSFRNANGTYTQYTADELFTKYTESSDSAQKYYDAVYNVAVREWFELEKNKALKAECDNKANIQLESLKTDADNAHSNNGTSYDTEWENILNSQLSNISEDKRNTNELVLKLKLDQYKSKLEDEFYDRFKKWDKTGATSEDVKNNLFWGENGYLVKKLPYHVKHILVNVDASNGDYYGQTISSSNVSKLYRVINELAMGGNFGDIAVDQSDDSGSAAMRGDLGIMDTGTAYVNEFKLGIYAYDTYFNTDNQILSASEDNPFRIPEKDGKFIKSLGIASIPYEVIEYMNEFKDFTTDANGKEVNDGNANYYPRNIFFNKYFNNHNLAFITPETLPVDTTPTLKNEGDRLNEYYTDLDENAKWQNGPESSTYANMPGFKEIKLRHYDVNGNPANGYETRKVLCDNDGNPILVVRAGSSYQGIHFIVVQRSALEATRDNVTLEQYYCSENPINSTSNDKNPDFPVDAQGNQLKTYVNTFVSNYDSYNERVNTIKSKVESFDPNYQYRIYEWLIGDQLAVNFNNVNGVNIENMIDNFINLKKVANESDERQSNITTWDSWIETLAVQQNQRKSKLIPETCALNFRTGFKNFDEDSIVRKACYYEK